MGLSRVFEVVSIPILLLLAGLVLLAAGAVWLWWRRRQRAGSWRRMEQALNAVSVDMLQDVLIPDGTGGHIHLEHLLLTAKGLVVIDTKDLPGAVFASDRMDDWTVIHTGRRYRFANPQRPLFDRVLAVKQLVRDLPVAGHVLFSDQADFAKGRPKMVLQPAELMERYKKPAKADLSRLLDAFYPHWERVRRETVSARVGTLLEDAG
jgi:LPXTG-motif cell wall-anchored protein